jgi:hypothetical protein
MAVKKKKRVERPEGYDYSRDHHKNNPNGEPTGHFTGRCMRCGSSDLWDDNLAYGCNSCGAFLSSNF